MKTLILALALPLVWFFSSAHGQVLYDGSGTVSIGVNNFQPDQTELIPLGTVPSTETLTDSEALPTNTVYNESGTVGGSYTSDALAFSYSYGDSFTPEQTQTPAMVPFGSEFDTTLSFTLLSAATVNLSGYQTGGAGNAFYFSLNGPDGVVYSPTSFVPRNYGGSYSGILDAGTYTLTAEDTNESGADVSQAATVDLSVEALPEPSTVGLVAGAVILLGVWLSAKRPKCAWR